MTNTIRIKRRAVGGSAGAPAALKSGEIAYNEQDNRLYYGQGDDGSSNATSIPSIAGAFEGFAAYKGSDQTSIATATATKLTFTTEEFDVGSKYDTSNSRYTPAAGKYLISAAYHFSAGMADQGYLRIYLYKNGALFKAVDQQTSGGGTATQGIAGSWLVDANGTDYFEVYCYGATTTSLTVIGSQGLTYFQAHRVG